MDLTNKDLKEVVQLLGDRKALKSIIESYQPPLRSPVSFMSNFDASYTTCCFNIYCMVYDRAIYSIL